MHPLGNDLTQLKEEELNTKFSELMKRLNQAHRFGPASVIPQLQMLIQDYQSEIQRRGALAMEEMRKAKEAAGLKMREEAERKAKLQAVAMEQTQRDMQKILEAERKAFEQAMASDLPAVIDVKTEFAVQAPLPWVPA